MPRDYKSRADSHGRQSTPGWVLFSAGFVLGLFVAGLAWVKLTPPGPGTQRAAAPSATRSVQADTGREAKGSRPRFDFYTLLPAQEVVVAEEEMQEPEPPASAAPPRKERQSYLLQMGAFRKYDDADRLKASLALLGIEAKIQRVSIDDKDTFHRVRSGPYSRPQANALHARLKSNSIPSLIIKVTE
ncbi:MAG: SPOR domain-containing protein [Chromatiales bacterium]